MGKIKEKMLDLAEMVEQILDSGVSDEELDEFMEFQLSPDEIEFYHSHKEDIFDILGIGNEDYDDEDYDEEIGDEYDDLTAEDYDMGNEDLNPSGLTPKDYGMDESMNEEYNKDDLSNYEREVGAILSAQLQDNDIEYDKDNLNNSLDNKMPFILQCMKDDMSSLDCAVELINDEEFMSEITYDEEEDYDDEETYDMDESLTMPTFSEFTKPLTEGKY